MPGINAFGTKLARGDGGDPEVYTDIANINTITGPSIERETLDVTSHDSPDGWMEFVGGLKDPGEVECEVNYDPSKHDLLVADFEDTVPRSWQMTFPDGATWTFPAFLSGFEPEAPYDDKLIATVTFKVAGKPALAAGA